MKVTGLLPHTADERFDPSTAQSVIGSRSIIAVPGKAPVYVYITEARVDSEGLHCTYEVPDEYAEFFALKNGYSTEGAEQ